MKKNHLLAQPPHVWGAPLLTGVMSLLLLLVAAPLAAGKPFKEIDVECRNGDSINRALERQEDELVINIIGVCTEDVVVTRDRVTLRGTDPALDGIRAASIDDPHGAALFIRGGRRVVVEDLTLAGGKHAGLLIEDVRRSTILRNLRIEGNQQVGLRISASLVAGYDLSITGNGIAGVSVFETAYLRCYNCTIADNPAADSGFGLVGAAGSSATLAGGSISARLPLSLRLNSVAEVDGVTLTGYVAVEARGNSNVKVENSTIDGSVRADEHSQIELRNALQVFNPAPAGNLVTGASQITVAAGTRLIGETVFAEFSHGIFDQGTALETVGCLTGSDAICTGAVTIASSSCSSC